MNTREINLFGKKENQGKSRFGKKEESEFLKSEKKISYHTL